MSKHRAKTSDIYGHFSNVVYPRPANAGLRFDFVFTRKGRWFYMSSCDQAEALAKTLKKPVEDAKERWRVVEAKTAVIWGQSK